MVSFYVNFTPEEKTENVEISHSARWSILEDLYWCLKVTVKYVKK